MSTIINLTPHAIIFFRDEDAERGVLKEGRQPFQTIPASGMVCRCAVNTAACGNLGGIPVSRQSFGALENLPAPQVDTYYVVSAIAGAQAARDGRTDVLTIAGAVRDGAGRIVGCTGLAFPA